jgi:hypothetical protein
MMGSEEKKTKKISPRPSTQAQGNNNEDQVGTRERINSSDSKSTVKLKQRGRKHMFTLFSTNEAITTRFKNK